MIRAWSVAGSAFFSNREDLPEPARTASTELGEDGRLTVSRTENPRARIDRVRCLGGRP